FGELERLVRLRLDQTQGGGDPPYVTSAWIASFPLRAPKRGVDSVSQMKCDFLEFGFVVVPAWRRSCGDDGQQCGQRRQAWYREREFSRARHSGRDGFQKFSREMEGKAAIADPMCMAAFEAMSLIAEQQRPRREHGRSGR